MPRHKISNITGATSAAATLAIVSALMIAPSFYPPDASAGSNSPVSTTLAVAPTMGLSAASVQIPVAPSSDGPVFNVGSALATVTTNNSTGYTLFLADDDSVNALIHSTLGKSTVIPSISESVSVTANPSDSAAMAAFPVNAWGYSLDYDATNAASTAKFNPIPVSREQVRTRDTKTEADGESTTITFGVKADMSVPSGTYTDTLLLSAIANYTPEADPQTNLFVAVNPDGTPDYAHPITKMQEMTPEVCANVPTPTAFLNPGTSEQTVNADVPETTLEDERDGNHYTVRKLADGNCWMVSNLKTSKEGLMAKNTTELNSSNTNVPADGSYDMNTADLPATFEIGTKTYPVGLYPSLPNGGNATANGGAYITYTDNVISHAGSGAATDNYTPPTATDTDNYQYNWHVAVLEKDGTSVEGSANAKYNTALAQVGHDICPAGWQLPNAAGDKSWAKLLYTSNNTVASPAGTAGIGTYGVVATKGGTYATGWTRDKLAQDPLNLTVTGRSWTDGYLRGTGGGEYWTNNVINAADAYDLWFYGTNVNPQHDDRGKQVGRSIRCVAKGSDNRTLSDISTMQDMTDQICKNTPTPTPNVTDRTNDLSSITVTNGKGNKIPEALLTDTRDGSTYRVRKLADGNCWMMDSLMLTKESLAAHDSTNTTGAVKVAQSDFTGTDYTLPASQLTQGTKWAPDSSDGAHVFDARVNFGGTGDGDYEHQVVYYNFTAATVGTIDNTAEDAIPAGQTEARHYPIDAPGTICPKGWTLPKNGDANAPADTTLTIGISKAGAITTGFDADNANTHSFINLMKVYGLAYNNQGVAYTNGPASQLFLRGDTNKGSDAVAGLGFPFSGYYRWNGAEVYRQGNYGLFRTSTATSATDANYLDFEVGYVFPQANSLRGAGFAVRCVAR